MYNIKTYKEKVKKSRKVGNEKANKVKMVNKSKGSVKGLEKLWSMSKKKGEPLYRQVLFEALYGDMAEDMMKVFPRGGCEVVEEEVRV